MTYIDTITVTRDGVGAADYTSNNPTLRALNSVEAMSIEWGDTAASAIPADSYSTFQTLFKIIVPTGMVAMYVPNKNINDDALRFHHNSWGAGTHSIILSAVNVSNAAGALIAGENLGYIYFVKTILDTRKIKLSFS